TGNVGHIGTGANIFRGHDNVQGATDLGLDVTTLPLYYGLAEDAWRHWCRVWEVDYDWMLSRFVNKTFMETPGVTSTRWFDATLLPKDQVSQPDTMKAMLEFKNDYDIMYLLVRKLSFADQMFKKIKVENGAVSAEDILREINRGGWSTGYCGQSPERLKAHMRNQSKFDVVTLRATKDDPEVGGEVYGLPWPCWGTPEFKHPGTPVIYNTNLPVKEGGGTFRARFGVERNGVS